MTQISDYEDYLHSLSLDGVRAEIKEWYKGGRKNRDHGKLLLKVFSQKYYDLHPRYGSGFEDKSNHDQELYKHYESQHNV